VSAHYVELGRTEIARMTDAEERERLEAQLAAIGT
jgi:hypothetical protein